MSDSGRCTHQQAAKMLGTTPTRVAHLAATGRLTPDGPSHVTEASVQARLDRRQRHHEQAMKDLEENPDAAHNVRLPARARAIRQRQQP